MTIFIGFATLFPNPSLRIPEIPRPKPLRLENDTVSILFLGDMMMHSKQLEYDCRTFLSGIETSIKEADVAVANMEFTLAGEPYSGYPAFSAPDSYAEYMADCGIDVFLTANNHILDKGIRGLRRTLSIYDCMEESHDIRYTGCAGDATRDSLYSPLIILRHGIKLALINFTYGTNIGDKESDWPKVNYMKRNEIDAAFRRAHERGADFIIALPHWGTEYQLSHSVVQQEWAQWLVAQGASAVIGAHPHVVQDSTHIDGVPVIYSLGNVVSNMSAINTRLELAVRIKFINHIDGRKEMCEPELMFMWCTLPGMLTDNYMTIFVDDYKGRREEWLRPSDYDNMMATLERVQRETRIRLK